MTRVRLAILGASPCHLCVAACCKQNGHDYAVLLRAEEYSKFGPFAVPCVVERRGVRVVERVLPYRDGRCVFLDEADRCGVYGDRPQNCRDFECVRGFQEGGEMGAHSLFLQRNPAVLEVLQKL